MGGLLVTFKREFTTKHLQFSYYKFAFIIHNVWRGAILKANVSGDSALLPPPRESQFFSFVVGELARIKIKIRRLLLLMKHIFQYRVKAEKSEQTITNLALGQKEEAFSVFIKTIFARMWKIASINRESPLLWVTLSVDSLRPRADDVREFTHKNLFSFRLSFDCYANVLFILKGSTRAGSPCQRRDALL